MLWARGAGLGARRARVRFGVFWGMVCFGRERARPRAQARLLTLLTAGGGASGLLSEAPAPGCFQGPANFGASAEASELTGRWRDHGLEAHLKAPGG
jgi:hypothetical protein